jgi:carbon-monoxide dehydrogenase medium subunit
MNMIPDMFEYLTPASLAEAVSALAADPGNVALAGGNGLLTQLKRGEVAPAKVVDLRKLDALRGLSSTTDGGLHIGALTTLTGLLDDPRVWAAHLPGALGDALALTGDVQARNRATIGGTLASAEPGSDLSAALLVLEAAAQVIGPNGSRVVTMAGLVDGTGNVSRGELITAVVLPPAEPGSAYCRLGNRANLHAICGVAVAVALGKRGTVTRCRIAVTGAMAYPRRLTELEAEVIGRTPPVLVSLPQDLSFVDDSLATADYRRQLTHTLTERALAGAVTRARSA